MQTLSILVDIQHIFHPLQLKDKSDYAHDQPTLCRRVGGIALLALSLFTFGIATGFFAYFAYRKVVHIEKRNRDDLDVRIANVFKETQGEDEGVEEKSEKVTFQAALKALQKGDKKALMAKAKELKFARASQEDESLRKMKNSLVTAAIEYNRVDEMKELWGLFETVSIDYHKVKSPEMMNMIIQTRSDVTGILDNKGNTVLHIIANGLLKDHPKLIADVIERIENEEERKFFVNRINHEGKTALMYPLPLESVKALVEAGADCLPEDEDSPLHHCKDPGVAEYLIKTFGDKIFRHENKEKLTFWETNQNVEVLRVMFQEARALYDTDGTGSDFLTGKTMLHEFPFGPPSSHPVLIADIFEELDEDKVVAFVNKVDKDGCTPLMTNSNPEVILLLIQKGANVQASDNKGRTVLHRLSEESFKDHPDLVHTILSKVKKKDRKDFVNTEDENGDVALAQNLPLSVVKALKEAGATYPEARKESPLDHCSDPKVAEYLIKTFGKEILLQRNQNGEIPLLTNSNVDVLRVFIQKIEALTELVDDNGDTILHAFTSGHLSQYPELIADVLKRIKDEDARKAFVNKQNNSGSTPLMSKKIPLGVVKALVEAGAEYPEEGKKSPLENCEDPEMVKLLTEKFGKGILKQKNENGKIPFLSNQNVDVVKAMIQEVEVENIEDLTDQFGYTILHPGANGIISENPELIRAVLGRIEDKDARKAFVNKKDSVLKWVDSIEVVKAILDHCPDCYMEGHGNPLHQCTNPELVNYLVGKFGTGQDHLEAKDRSGNTPLMSNDNSAIVQMLIDYGANVHATHEKSGFQPLFFAKSIEVANKLIQAGADIHAKGKHNRSVLFGEISPEVAEWLIEEHGFKVDDKDEIGMEPIHNLCDSYFNVELAKVLMGDRTNDHDWKGNVPKIMKNYRFKKWLEGGKPSQ